MQIDPIRPAPHHRRSIRLQCYDYRQAGAYFVTVCTRERACLFGTIADELMRLNDAGSIVEACWQEVPRHFPGVDIDACVIMPNHFHAIVVIGAEDRETPPPQPASGPTPSPVGAGSPRPHFLPDDHPATRSASIREAEGGETPPLQTASGPTPSDPAGAGSPCPLFLPHDHPATWSGRIREAKGGETPPPQPASGPMPFDPVGAGSPRPLPDDHPATRSASIREAWGGETPPLQTASGPTPSDPVGAPSAARPASGPTVTPSPWAAKRPTLGQVIGYFKFQSSQAIAAARGLPRFHLWQRNYYEHIIRSDASLAAARRYIAANPARWRFDRENPQALCSPV